MPTVLSHAVIGLVAAEILAGRRSDGRLRFAAVAVTVLPDLDHPLLEMVGLHDHGPLAHRGLTHGVPFALVLTALVTWGFFRRRPLPWWRAALALAVAAATHGVLDALTDGGSGVAFLAPFSDARTFLAWRPIPVAPLSVRGIFTSYGQYVLEWEGIHLILPALGVLAVVLLVRLLRSPSCGDAGPGASGPPRAGARGG